jgi:hypothetical protein
MMITLIAVLVRGALTLFARNVGFRGLPNAGRQRDRQKSTHQQISLVHHRCILQVRKESQGSLL